VELGRVVARDRDIFASAAWLHDIGYTPALIDTGFQPPDAARFLRCHGLSRARR
jgi:hypothetical protein